jgi:hypothetical protein
MMTGWSLEETSPAPCGHLQTHRKIVIGELISSDFLYETLTGGFGSSTVLSELKLTFTLL